MKSITCLAISDDSRALCIADAAGSIAVYDMRDKKVVKLLIYLHGEDVQVTTMAIMYNLPDKL